MRNVRGKPTGRPNRPKASRATAYVVFILSVLSVFFGLQPALKYFLSVLSERVPGVQAAAGFYRWSPQDFWFHVVFFVQFALLYALLLRHIRFAWVWAHLFILTNATSLLIVAAFHIAAQTPDPIDVPPGAVIFFMLIFTLIFRAWYVQQFLQPRWYELKQLRGGR